MADTIVLNRLKAQALDRAVQDMAERLPEDADEARELLFMASRDVVGKSDPGFQSVALISALVEIVVAQQKQLDALRDALQAKSAKAARK